MAFKLNPFTGMFDYYEAAAAGSGDMTKAVYDAANIAQQLVGLTATQTLTNKTLTSPKINENVALTTTATKLNLLTSAAGTTGTASTNIVFSTSPSLTTPILGTPTSGDLSNCTFPTLNQNTTGSAASLKSPSTTGVMRATGMGIGTTRDKTVRDANDTILELGGSYTPTGTFTSLTMVTPVLGTPTSGTLTNCTGLPEGGLSTTDITTNNVSTTKHGFAPKLPNDATKYLDGTGAYTVPAGGGGGTNSTILTSCGTGASATRFFGIGQSSLENATETSIFTFKMPFAATLKNLYATVVTPPGAGKSWTVTVRTDESVTDTMADTTLTCSIADTAVSASDTTHTPTVSAGKRVTISMTRVSTAASPSNVTFSLEAVHS